MSIKETLENNLIVVMASVSIASGGLVFGVAQYFHNQEKDRLSVQAETREAELRQKLASIRRELPGAEHYDIRDLMISPESAVGPGGASEFFQGFHFYAVRYDNFWKYSLTSEFGLMKMILDEEFVEEFAGMNPKFRDLLEAQPIHLWRSAESLAIRTKDGTDMKLFSHIAVQHLPYESLDAALGTGAYFGKWLDEEGDLTFDAEDLSEDEDVEDLIKKLSGAAYDDVAGFCSY